MNAVKTLVTRRRAALLGAGLTLAALALALGLPTESNAAWGCGIAYRYYSDASHGDQIGERGHSTPYCGCIYGAWGVTSSHYELFEPPC